MFSVTVSFCPELQCERYVVSGNEVLVRLVAFALKEAFQDARTSHVLPLGGGLVTTTITRPSPVPG